MTDASTSVPARRAVPLWVQGLIWAGLIGLLVLLAVGLSRKQQGTVQPGERVGNFRLELFSGYEYNGQSQITLDEVRGKVLLINFWASWCKPCEQEAGELRSAWNYYKSRGDVLFLGVDYVDTEPHAREYLKKFDITFPNGPDIGTRISQQFRIKGVPETYFIDRDGVLRFVQVGPFTSEDQIRAIIDPLLE
ncbi:MAG TPA: TlpA disulfide reductase family protein [Anaerolineales bacterium]|nr:TlpA disulfide reductase family protein [Anaerolineales bacterium]